MSIQNDRIRVGGGGLCCREMSLQNDEGRGGAGAVLQAIKYEK